MMKKKSLIDDYLKNYSVGKNWEFRANGVGDISQVVVIPAYAEKEYLFHTLASLAKNNPSDREQSLILCVVNNRVDASGDVKENNRQTMECLGALVGQKSISGFAGDRALHPLLAIVADAGMKLGYVDASSPGREMPASTGGVGMARKIGMDIALTLLRDMEGVAKVIVSLDADTLVRENYLSVIRHHFQSDARTAIVAYEHQLPQDPRHQAAIICYEIFLRYWILGLKFARSPWAFHTIGSTMAVSPDAYLQVRGMNKREAGEDFYFLNKLAKIGSIDCLQETRVYPSARASLRVPFGTGKRIQRFLDGGCPDEYCLYDPRVFSVLGEWLQLAGNMFFGRGEEVLEKAGQIHPRLNAFLMENNFLIFWSKIHRTAKDKKTLARHFHDWFDGFKTLKMIHDLTRDVYPQINMFDALEKMADHPGFAGLNFSRERDVPPLPEQLAILRRLRGIT